MGEYIITREGVSVPIIDVGEIEAYPNKTHWNATIYDSKFTIIFPNRNGQTIFSKKCKKSGQLNAGSDDSAFARSSEVALKAVHAIQENKIVDDGKLHNIFSFDWGKYILSMLSSTSQYFFVYSTEPIDNLTIDQLNNSTVARTVSTTSSIFNYVNVVGIKYKIRGYETTFFNLFNPYSNPGAKSYSFHEMLWGGNFDLSVLEEAFGTLPTILRDDEYGYYSENGGYGGGSFDDSSDSFGLPSLPSLGVSEVGFINVYNPSKGQLQGFADELFPNFEMPTPSTATGIEAVAENLANTFEVLGDFAESYVNAGLVNYVIDCHIVPVAPTTSGTAKIKVGFKSFNYTPAKVTSDYVEFDCGSLEIAEYYQNFLDYEGTKAKLYLPFIGFVDIKPEWFQSGKLGVTYHFNIIDGSCIAFVIATSSKSKLKNTVVATFGGNCCVHMPITGVNYSSMISGVVGGAVGIASNASNMIKTNQRDKGTVMSNIEGATGIASNLADAVGAKPSIEQSNGYNAGMSFMCYRRPYLLIERPVASFSQNYPKEQGLPLNVTKKLGDMKGFTTCTAPVVDNFHCLEEEKEMIKQALIEGTIF